MHYLTEVVAQLKIAASLQETARGSLGQDYSEPRQGSSVTGMETVKAGSLQKVSMSVS